MQNKMKKIINFFGYDLTYLDEKDFVKFVIKLYESKKA